MRIAAAFHETLNTKITTPMDKETKTIIGDFNLSADRLANHFCKKHGVPDLTADMMDAAYWEDGLFCKNYRENLLYGRKRHRISLTDIALDLQLDLPCGVSERYCRYCETGGEIDGEVLPFERWLADEGYNHGTATNKN